MEDTKMVYPEDFKMNVTVDIKGKKYFFEGLETILWSLAGTHTRRPAIEECNGHVVRGVEL